MFANGQFVIFSFISMLFYRGGYSFAEDPLSALGFTIVAGKSNLVSSLIFNTSMFLVGTSVIFLFPAMLPYFENTVTKFFATTGSVFAVFSGIAMCGAALTPGDINFDAHVAFAPFTFLFGFLMIFFYSIAIILNKDFPNIFGFLLILYSIFTMITLLLIYVGSAAYTLEGSIIQILSQKISIYAEILVLFLLSLGAYRYS
jgi:hypothetical protein